MIINDVEKLEPNFRDRVKLWLKDNPEILVVETYRNQARQNMLYARGSSRTLHSMHTKCLALDIAFTGSVSYPTDIAPWRKIADSAKKYGIAWSFDIPGFGWEKCHFEDSSLFSKNMQKIISKCQDIWKISDELETQKLPEKIYLARVSAIKRKSSEIADLARLAK